MADRCSICGLYIESLSDIDASGAIGKVGTAFTKAVSTKFRLIMEHRSHVHLATYQHVEGTLTDDDLFVDR